MASHSTDDHLNGANGVANGSEPVNVAKKRRIWDIRASKMGYETHNPIRAVVERLNVQPNPNLKRIQLSIGDPTVFGHLPPPANIVKASLEGLEDPTLEGEGHPHGLLHAREAVAKYYSKVAEKVTADDVFITCGCSGAIELAVQALTQPGDNILIPTPGFGLYKTIAEPLGVECIDYQLKPDCRWEADLEDLESKINSRTRFLVIINPSNPCGSVYSDKHMKELTNMAAKHRLLILADEIYYDMAFEEYLCHMAVKMNEEVPVLMIGGMAKRFMVPGWRVGWMVVFDRNNILKSAGLLDILGMLTLSIGSACTVLQHALVSGLEETPQQYHKYNIDTLHTSAKLLYDKLSQVEGLCPVVPQGAMYIMVGIEISKFKDITDDQDFTKKLLAEQAVGILPGQCFRYPNFVRLTVSVPVDMIEEACKRIEVFCSQHRKD